MHGIIYSTRLCVPAHKGIADRNGMEHGFSRGEPRPRHGSRALLEGRGGEEGLARAGFSVIRPPTNISAWYFFIVYLRVIFIFTDIFISPRDPSVSWPIRGRGSANSRWRWGGGGGGDVCVCVCVWEEPLENRGIKNFVRISWGLFWSIIWKWIDSVSFVVSFLGREGRGGGELNLIWKFWILVWYGTIENKVKNWCSVTFIRLI